MDKINEVNINQRNYLHEYLDLRQDITILYLDYSDLHKNIESILRSTS